MDTYTLCFQCVLLMIKESFLFGAQGLVSVVSTSQRSLPEPLKTHLRPSPRAPRDWSKQQIGTISQTASSFTSTLICFLASHIFVSLIFTFLLSSPLHPLSSFFLSFSSPPGPFLPPFPPPPRGSTPILFAVFSQCLLWPICKGYPSLDPETQWAPPLAVKVRTRLQAGGIML